MLICNSGCLVLSSELCQEAVPVSQEGDAQTLGEQRTGDSQEILKGGRKLWRSSNLPPGSKPGHLEQVAQGCIPSSF